MPKSSQNNNNHSINFSEKIYIKHLVNSLANQQNKDVSLTTEKKDDTNSMYSHATKAKDIKEKQSPRLPSSAFSLSSYRISQIPEETEINLSFLAIFVNEKLTFSLKLFSRCQSTDEKKKKKMKKNVFILERTNLQENIFNQLQKENVVVEGYKCYFFGLLISFISSSFSAGVLFVTKQPFPTLVQLRKITLTLRLSLVINTSFILLSIYQ